MVTKRAKRRKRLLFFTLSVFVFFSNRWIADHVMQKWELPFNRSAYNQSYDVAIVLGGLSSVDKKTDNLEWQPGSDRLLYPLTMYRQGKVKKILITGGSGSLAEPNRRESVYLRRFLLNLNVPDSDIIIEKESKNTHENAVFTQQMLKERKLLNSRLLLVTSAYHMRRSMGCFKKVGLKFDILPVDFFVSTSTYYIDQWFIPDPEAFKIWQTLIKEVVGFWVYKFKDYI